MKDILFYLGNAIAIVGGFFALAWVMTSSRFYWRKRRRGIAALVFIAVGIFLMVSSGKAASSGKNNGSAVVVSSAHLRISSSFTAQS